MKLDIGRWSPSGLNTFELCEHKFFLNKGRRLTPISKTLGQKAMWGRAWHSTLDVYDLSIFQGNTIEKALEDAIRYAWSLKEQLRPDNPSQYWDNSRTLDTLLRSICWYSEKYGDDPLKLATMPDGKAAIEIPYTVSTPGNPDKTQHGIMDRLIEYEGALYILDRKSTGSDLSGYYFAQFTPDNQVMHYIWGVRYGLGIPVAGLMIDACQVLVSGTRFARQAFDVTVDQMNEWLDTLDETMKRADRCNETGVWPMRFSACSMYGGCEFRPICRTCPNSRESKIKELFTEREDDRR